MTLAYKTNSGRILRSLQNRTGGAIERPRKTGLACFFEVVYTSLQGRVLSRLYYIENGNENENITGR